MLLTVRQKVSDPALTQRAAVSNNAPYEALCQSQVLDHSMQT